MTIRCGLVGAGHWARTALLPALRAIDGVEVVASAAANEEEASRFAAAEGIPASFGDIEAMLSRAAVDVAVVATPDHVHASAVRACLSSGTAVYVEKPLANDSATAGELADLADATGITATVGYSFRFSPALQALKRDLDAGILGDPWLIELAEHNPQFHPLGRKPMNWKGDPAQAGAGALFEYGSHVVDMATWLVGPVARVSTSFKRVLPGARLDDIATLQMEFAGGAIGTLVSSWVLTGGFPGIRIRLHGSKATGEVAVDDRFEGGQDYRVRPAFGPGEERRPLEPMANYFTEAPRRHLGDLIAKVGGHPPRYGTTLPTLRQGAHVQDVLDAAVRATEAWCTVRTA